MSLNMKTITTGLGIKTNYSQLNYGKLKSTALDAVDELDMRKGISGQFLNWIRLPEEQLKRVDYIYDVASQLKNQTNAQYLSIIGIGGSKHPIEHMLGINGLNLDKKIKFLSDIDSVSHNRFIAQIGGDVRNSNYLVVSKSGTTFEPKDAMLRIKNKMTDIFETEGRNQENAKELASKHFVAVTDKNPLKSELRNTATIENWLGKLFIHDDVGGRFSAFDDHTLFALAYAGLKKSDMIKMLEGARDMSKLALSKDLQVNDPLAQAMFWVHAKLQHLKTTVHQYLGSMFEDSVNWHAQMQNESIKTTLKQITKVPDAMHHSAEAHFNPANTYAFALTSPADNGILSQNVNGYVDALGKSYSNAGKYFNEIVDVSDLGLTPQASGALTQSRAFSTVYQELIEKLHNIKIGKEEDLPVVLDSVLQPFVEIYKKNLKPDALGNNVVEAGRILNKEV